VRRWLAVTGTVLLIAAWWTLPVAAASPPAAPGTPEGLQVWLDSDSITPDAPPGGVLQVGYTFWDTRVGDFPNVENPYVKLHPAKGKAAPSEAMIEQDFQGHILATVTVPEGGVGKLEVGLQAGGKDIPLTIAGTGPPPAAPPQDLVTATIQPLVGDTVAGRAFPLTVEVQPRGLYDQSALPLPDDVIAVARRPGGPGLSTGDLRRSGDLGTPYTGKLSIPETGDVEIAIQVPVPGGGNYEVPGSVITRTVIAGGPKSAPPAQAPASASASAAPVPTSPQPAAAASGGIPAIAWILGIGVVVVVLVLVGRRVLADL
jgi:hypothetical protein